MNQLFIKHAHRNHFVLQNIINLRVNRGAGKME